MKDIGTIADFLIDIERLKLVTRRAYVSDLSRRENSAEHSWHLAVGLLVVSRELGLKIDLHKALAMALIHDVCEVDAGDTPLYGPKRPDQQEAEARCMARLAEYDLGFTSEMHALWLEYEAKSSAESRWVRVLDRFMPFLVNLGAKGRNWQEQSISRSQLLGICGPIREDAPELYEWMLARIEDCVRDGWLRDA